MLFLIFFLYKLYEILYLYFFLFSGHTVWAAVIVLAILLYSMANLFIIFLLLAKLETEEQTRMMEVYLAKYCQDSSSVPGWKKTY